jgi:hypothetical protein
MAFTKKTLADCLQSLADRHESNGTLPSSSEVISYWTRILNKGVNYCADKLRLTKTTTLTTSGGSIALPDDFLIRDSVFVGDQEYIQVDPSDKPSQVGLTYWITGNQTEGFTLHAPDDNTFTVNYGFKPEEMISNSDICIIPDIEAPVAYAYAMIRKRESDPFEDAEAALQECDTRLKEIQSTSAINSDSTHFDWN